MASGDTKWIFGLSLDEEIEWCLAKLGHDNEPLPGAHNRIKSPPISSEILGRYAGEFQSFLRHELVRLKEQHPAQVSEVVAVGVSMVGIADRQKITLHNIGRKDWGKPGQTPVVNFVDLFDGIFERDALYFKESNGLQMGTAQNSKINIHNESTAKCLAEWRKQELTQRKTAPQSLFYVMFSDGVNGGFVSSRMHLVTESHTEMGHIWARPYRNDFKFNIDHSGCRIHKYCFEGFASAKRIRESWASGKDVHLRSLGNHPEKPWEVISFYIAQMCMNGILTFSPERILLGGHTIFKELLPLIETYVEKFNRGDTDEPYLDYEAMFDRSAGKLRPGFIQMASIPPNDAGLEGALELARRVYEDPVTALRNPESIRKRRR